MNDQPELPNVATTGEIQTSLLARTIRELRGLPSLGDYPNWWCDIISDEQEGFGNLLDDPYRGAVLGILCTLIRQLSSPDIERLWLTTERGDEYAWEKQRQADVGEPDENGLSMLYRTQDDRIDDIARHLLNELREMAYKADLEAELRREKSPREP